MFERAIKNFRLSNFLRGERGSQLVELAIVLPIMCVMLAAIAEFGHFFYTYSTLAKATRGGARYMTSKTFSTTEKNKAKSLAVYGDANAGCTGEPIIKGLTCANMDVQGVGGAAGFPDKVNVKVINYTYTPLFDLGKLTKNTFSLAVPVSPGTTMKYLLF